VHDYTRMLVQASRDFSQESVGRKVG